MSSYVLFLLLGLGSGAVYGILALGLVLKYRAAGVVDFGHGAVAMFIAYVYLGLRDDRGAAVPVGGPPARDRPRRAARHGARRSSISLVYAAMLGLVMYWLIYRPLRSATALTRVCASVGTMLALQAIAVLNYGTTAKSTPTILPTEPLAIGGITVPSDRLWFAGIVVVLAAVLAAVYRFTRFGLATRASAENERGASLIGLSANRIGARQLGARDDAGGHRRDPDRAGLDGRPDVVHAVHRPRARRRAGRALPVVRGRGGRRPGARHAAVGDHQAARRLGAGCPSRACRRRCRSC